MGIWADHGFANDEAMDWLAHLDAAEGLQPLRQVMRGAVEAEAPTLDPRQAGHLLAAVELVAAARGRPHGDLPEAARRWCAAQAERPDDALRILATRALDLVGTSSALAEIWSQRPDEATWHAALDDLRMRLVEEGDPGGTGAAGWAVAE